MSHYDPLVVESDDNISLHDEGYGTLSEGDLAHSYARTRHYMSDTATPTRSWTVQSGETAPIIEKVPMDIPKLGVRSQISNQVRRKNGLGEQLPRNVPRRVKGRRKKVDIRELAEPIHRVSVEISHTSMDIAKIVEFIENNTKLGSLTSKAHNAMFSRRIGSNLQGKWLRPDLWETTMYRDLLVLKEREPDSIDENYRFREVFIFSFGAVVMWNWDSEIIENDFVRSLNSFGTGSIASEIKEDASDDMEYYFGEKFSVRNDVVELCSRDIGERLAVSYALSQSCLLSVFEARVDEVIQRNEHIPMELAKRGRIHMSQTAISQEMGRLFMERNTINLDCDLLGTPDHFWEHDEWEHIYRKMGAYLEQANRIDILNKRLDCIHELLDVLSTQVENQHASSLEWIIIWLIVSEVVVQLLWNVLIKDILGYFQHCS